MHYLLHHFVIENTDKCQCFFFIGNFLRYFDLCILAQVCLDLSSLRYKLLKVHTALMSIYLLAGMFTVAHLRQLVLDGLELLLIGSFLFWQCFDWRLLRVLLIVLAHFFAMRLYLMFFVLFDCCYWHFVQWGLIQWLFVRMFLVRRLLVNRLLVRRLIMNGFFLNWVL